MSGNTVSFFLDDFKTAEKLYAADRTIQCPDGFKMLIRVSNGLPQVDVNPELKEKLKQAMAKRYEPNLKALDLTKFHIDPVLADHFCALFKPILMLAVIEIIAENIPEIEALNLADNRIQILDHLKDLKKKLPNIKVLHLGNNKVRSSLYSIHVCNSKIIRLFYKLLANVYYLLVSNFCIKIIFVMRIIQE